MKFLKIDSNKGYYTIDGDSWSSVDQIGKEDILALVDRALTDEFEMDAFEQDKIGNQAHRIIYKQLHDKFDQLHQERTRFRDESEALYKSAIEKYSQ